MYFIVMIESGDARNHWMYKVLAETRRDAAYKVVSRWCKDMNYEWNGEDINSIMDKYDIYAYPRSLADMVNVE